MGLNILDINPLNPRGQHNGLCHNSHIPLTGRMLHGGVVADVCSIGFRDMVTIESGIGEDRNETGPGTLQVSVYANLFQKNIQISKIYRIR